MAASSDWIWRCCALISFLYIGECLPLATHLPSDDHFSLAAMSLLVQGQKVRGSQVYFTDQVTMEISLHYHVRDSRDIFVEECVANDETLLQHGCSLDTKLLPNFHYDQRDRVHTTFPAFREVTALHTATVDFVCRVFICPAQCPRPQCTGDPEQNARDIRSHLMTIAGTENGSGLSPTTIELIIVAVILFVVIGASVVVVIFFKVRVSKRRKEASVTGSTPDPLSIDGILSSTV